MQMESTGEMLLNTVINRPLEKSVEKHNKHAARTMDCHLSLMIYDLVASCLFLLYSLRCGAAACRSVNTTSLLHWGDLSSAQQQPGCAETSGTGSDSSHAASSHFRF